MEHNNDYTSIFRIQDKDGRGPWKPGFSHKWVEDRADLENLIPWPLQFGMGVLKKAIAGMSLGCGCRSTEQLRKWFTPSEYQTLLKYGYHAVKMDAVLILAESDIQCVFKRVKLLNENVEVVNLY